ncbi:unnamed protein product [Caenorhabditis angaria]|uniref:G-protein coupled receptors family 1 profile domain-containing protein n=1 Tax=Caenorhabditis angaria TaxID=860376 RepID=A0A9P1IT49_9PELO|nr:unnamed protein product [Caenorhabditis angaria]
MFGDVHPWMIPITFFYLIIIPIGISGNFIMVLCYFKNPRLRTPFHILLTLTCLADLMHVCGQIVFVYHLLAEVTIPQPTCFLINFLPILGLTSAGPLLFEIGLDRLFAVTFPFRYRNSQNQRFRYTVFHLMFPIIYSSGILYLGFLERDFEKQVRCAIPTSLNGASFKLFTLSSHAIYVSIIFAYCLTGILLRMRDASEFWEAESRGSLRCTLSCQSTLTSSND